MKNFFYTLCSVSLITNLHAIRPGEENTSTYTVPTCSSINGPSGVQGEAFKAARALFEKAQGGEDNPTDTPPKAKTSPPSIAPKPKAKRLEPCQGDGAAEPPESLKPKPAPGASKGETLPRTSVGALKIVGNAHHGCPQAPLVPEAPGRQTSVNIFPPLSLIPDTTPKEATEAIVARATKPKVPAKPLVLHPTVQTPYLQGSLPAGHRLSRIEETQGVQTMDVPQMAHAETMTELSNADSLEKIMERLNTLTKELGQSASGTSSVLSLPTDHMQKTPPPSPAYSTCSGSGIEAISVTREPDEVIQLCQNVNMSPRDNLSITSVPSSATSEGASLLSSVSRSGSPISFGSRPKSKETVGEAEAQKNAQHPRKKPSLPKKKRSWLLSCFRG
jgi:hypothetical protein